MYSVKGIDISHHQKYISWEKFSIQNAGRYSFIFIKATEGSTHVDTRFGFNWKSAAIAGLHRGAYHFFSLRSSATAQAFNFMKQVQLAEGDLPPVLDYEVDPSGIVSLSYARKEVSKWLYLVEKKYGVKPVIYTNITLYNKVFKGYFNDFNFWLADYNKYQPRIHIAGEKVRFWQYTESGRVPGISGNVDLNVFLGPYEDLACLAISQ